MKIRLISRLKIKPFYKYTLIFILIFSIGWWITRLPSPIFKTDYSTVITDENGKILRVYLNSNSQWILPPEKASIPDKLKKSVLTFEDKRFYSHIGIDFLALFRAIKQDIAYRKVVSGASTITMQTARTVKQKNRTTGNKLIEMAQALKLEL